MTNLHSVPFANSTWAFAQEDEGPIKPAIGGQLHLQTPMMRPAIGVGKYGRVEIRSASTVYFVSCRSTVHPDTLRPMYELEVTLHDGRTCWVPSTSLFAFRRIPE